jgi:DNA-binding winged helix-turn-helix (wHTH) protein/Flp pilus assembly protein TadD
MKTDALTFGPFEVDLSTVELRRDGVVVPLEPLPVRILARLAAHPGAMVPREELEELGWPGTPWVAEQSLNTCIYQVRRALARGGPPGVNIETLRGRGYRLTVLRSHAVEEEQRLATAPRRLLIPIATAVLVTGILVTVSVRDAATGDTKEAEGILIRARYLARETQDLESARAVLDSGLMKFPEVAGLQAEWGELNIWLGDLEAAARGAEQALAIDPRSATAHRTRGVLAMLRSDWASADAALAKALSYDATDPRNLTALAFLRTIELRFDEGRRLMEEALRIDPLSATIHLDAGLAYMRMGRYEDAERSCREVLRFRPRSTWGIDCLFDVMVLTDRPADAARWGRRLLELYDAPAPPNDVSPEVVVARTEAWRLDRWQEAVDHGAYPLGLALAYTANGRANDAIAALRAAAEHPQLGLLTMAVDPRLARLRRYGAFRALQDRLKLPASAI